MNELIVLLKASNKGLVVLGIAIMLDVVSGVVRAVLSHSLKSSEFRTGILKKVLDFVLVIVGFALDWLLSFNYIGMTVLYFLIAMEFYSVLENIREYMPLPDVVVKVLEMLAAKGNENG